VRLAHRELGSGSPVLLLHGWPTSSYLWRHVMPAIAERNRVIAVDLPGFGGSDKPAGAAYDFEFFESAIDAFLEQLGIEQVSIGVHDIGGPIGAHWALKRPSRVTSLALLNTLLYPELSDAALLFVQTLSNPEGRERLTSPEGLSWAMKFGVADESRLDAGVLAEVSSHFKTGEAREALADAGIGLQIAGFREIADWLPTVDVPVRMIYGEQDRILPDIADTAARVKKDIPHAEITALPGCGHFLQEEEPEEIGRMLADFFAARDERPT